MSVARFDFRDLNRDMWQFYVLGLLTIVYLREREECCEKLLPQTNLNCYCVIVSFYVLCTEIWTFILVFVLENLNDQCVVMVSDSLILLSSSCSTVILPSWLLRIQ